jgi:hypothetical protein
MFDRIARSFELVKASATLLRQDPHLLVFPFISGLAAIFVAVSFALPVLGLAGFGAVVESEAIVYSSLFLFYVAQYFVMFYFNVALVGAVMIRLDGGAPTVADGLAVANKRLGAILGYAVIAATVGVILRAIQERVGFLGRLIVGMLGIGWTVATFMVVPVLVSGNKGPIESIKDSAGMLKRTWGENVVGQVGMGLFFSLLYFALVLGGVALAIGAAALGSTVLMVVVLAIGLLALLACVLVQTALAGIYSAALYRYAVAGDASTGFDNQALQGAFLQK